ncbi:helix-turn-helix domain-containing protein [Gordonia sp. ABSL49_1]|uniref:helix-turn-helix domain-containing protein n=1 Tax=Gordonia sp. ABSL49_1 TaxID=2920941 RepID=UPI001F0D079E|nr:helix-turn-helix transcriptional regulator [Gordonia sp. ABSL49_1]MCH5645117.1 helix-turn-helix domain-containing protein [Gordonia sp. ABSL49_1]
MDTSEDALNQAVGAELRAERARIGWSRDETAERAGVPVRTLQRYEDGSRAIPVPVLWRLLTAFAVDFAEFERAVTRTRDQQQATD